MTARPRLPRSSRRPPSALNGSRDRPQHVCVAAVRGRGRARRSSPSIEHAAPARRRAGRRPTTVCTSPCSSPASSSSRITKPDAAGGLELVHVGAAVRVDARQQRHHARQVVEVVPVDDDAGRARDRHQVDRVVGRAAGGQQRRRCALTMARSSTMSAERQVVAAERGDRSRALRRGARQRVAQRRAGVHEGRARQVQAHDLHQHLVAVGGAVEGAGARRVVGCGLGFEQLVAADLALRRSSWRTSAFSLLDRPEVIGPARHEDRPAGGRTCSAPISRPGTILSQTPRQQRGVEHVVRQRDRRGHRDHVAAEQRQFHARLALRDAVAHRRHAAGELRRWRRPRAPPRLISAGKRSQRLVRRQHVVVGRDDGDVGPHQRPQRLPCRRHRRPRSRGRGWCSRGAPRAAPAPRAACMRCR